MHTIIEMSGIVLGLIAHYWWVLLILGFVFPPLFAVAVLGFLLWIMTP